MKSIAQALIMYIQRSQGKFPDDLGELLASSSGRTLSPASFVCPNAEHEHVPGRNSMTPEQVTDWMNANTDYIYIGKGHTTGSAKSETVILYEKPQIENLQGINMLYGDGHVNFMSLEMAEKLIEESNRQRAANQQ